MTEKKKTTNLRSPLSPLLMNQAPNRSLYPFWYKNLTPGIVLQAGGLHYHSWVCPVIHSLLVSPVDLMSVAFNSFITLSDRLSFGKMIMRSPQTPSAAQINCLGLSRVMRHGLERKGASGL
jgi:hypothetical protein